VYTRIPPPRRRSIVIEKIDLARKLALFQETWSPKIVGRVNDCLVKLVKLRASSCGTTTRRRTSCSSCSRVA
jgi:hypothetical protein